MNLIFENSSLKKIENKINNHCNFKILNLNKTHKTTSSTTKPGKSVIACTIIKNEFKKEIQKIKKALNKKGVFIFSVPNNYSIFGKLMTCYFNYADKTHISTYPREQWIDLLKKEGCAVAYICADAHSLKALEFYESFGFKRLLQNHTYLGKSGKRYVDTDGLLAPVTSRKLFNQILATPTPFDIGKGNW